MDITVQSIKDEFDANVDRHEHHIIDRGMQGAIVGTLESACGKKPENRHRVLKMLCGVTSSKQLSSPHWSALYSLVLPWKPEGGKWQSGNPNLEEICNVLLNADMDQPGQAKMFTNEPQVWTETEFKQAMQGEWTPPEDEYEPPF